MTMDKHSINLNPNLFTQAIEISLDGIVIGDKDGYIGYVNQAIVKLVDADDKSFIIGKHVLDFVDPTDKQRALESSLQSIKTGRGWTGKFNILQKTGGLVPIEITAAPIKNQSGETIAFIDIVRNISERVQTEKLLKEAQINLEVANEKLLVMGGLVRHDISNKLTNLNLHAFLANKNGDFNDLFNATLTASAQITRTLNFSRDYEDLGKQPLGFLNVGVIFKTVAACFPDAKVNVLNECVDLQVLADNLFGELLYNLFDNTLKYGKTTKTIKLSHQPDGENLKLIYEDDGVGIPITAKGKLFAKGVGQGTGLGLYLVKKTVEVYGWHISETGAPNMGARFEVAIPKSDFNLEPYS